MEEWSSRLGFVLAAIGAAVGLGNIWRFPAVVGENGGGAYLIPYLIAAFAFAVPLMILEISVGRSLEADVVTACRQVRERFEIVGWLIAGSVLLVLSYYLVITGWVLAFFLGSITGSMPTFVEFTTTNWPLVTFTVSTVIVGGVVSLGVQDGIERMSRVLIPFTFLILIILLGYVATLEGFVDGLRFFFTPDLSVLGDPLLWSAAFGQVFFSFSVGMGIMLTYGSYLSPDADVPRSALLIAVADITVAMLAGMIIFGIVFAGGLEPASGTELAFTTLPAAFAEMPGGPIIAVAFFGLLFIAAVSSSVSMLEVGVAGITRTTGWSRQVVSIVTAGAILVIGLPSALSYSAIGFSVSGQPFLDALDGSVGSLGLPLGAIAIIIIFTWVQDPVLLDEQLGESIVRPLVKFVVPVILAVVTVLRVGVGITSPWQRLPTAAAVLGSDLLLLGAGLGVLLVGTAVLLSRTKRSKPT